MEDRAWLHPVLLIAGLIVGFCLGAWTIHVDYYNTHPVNTVTVEKTVDRPVPGPETTVEKTIPGKRKPGTTTWIIVCGETTHRVVNDKPTTECKLPNTGP